MTDDIERSGSGEPIWRHKPREKPFELAIGDTDIIEAVGKHIATHVGEPATVMHELISDLVHVDVHVVAPRPDRNFFTLVTSGMSDRAMNTPDEIADRAHAELMICLPPDWPVLDNQAGKGRGAEERWWWPVRLLKMLARFPHEYDTWFGWGHTIPNGDPPEPYADNTRLCGVMLTAPATCPEAFRECRLRAETTIRFYALVPIFADEMEFKLREGAEALCERFGAAGVTELLNPRRRSVCRPWWRFW